MKNRGQQKCLDKALQLPYPAKPNNIQKLENYLLDKFCKTALNQASSIINPCYEFSTGTYPY